MNEQEPLQFDNPSPVTSAPESANISDRDEMQTQTSSQGGREQVAQVPGSPEQISDAERARMLGLELSKLITSKGSEAEAQRLREEIAALNRKSAGIVPLREDVPTEKPSPKREIRNHWSNND